MPNNNEESECRFKAGSALSLQLCKYIDMNISIADYHKIDRLVKPPKELMVSEALTKFSKVGA